MTTVTAATRSLHPKGGLIVETTPGAANHRHVGTEYEQMKHVGQLEVRELLNVKGFSLKKEEGFLISQNSDGGGARNHNLADIDVSVLGPFTVASTANLIAAAAHQTKLTQAQGGVISIATETAKAVRIHIQPFLSLVKGATGQEKKFLVSYEAQDDIVDASTGITYKIFDVYVVRPQEDATNAIATDGFTLTHVITRIRNGLFE